MAACLLIAAPAAQAAVVYSQNFESATIGSTNLGDGSVIAGFGAGATSVQTPGADIPAPRPASKMLRLTREGIQAENGTWKIPGFAGAANGWRAEFNLTIGDLAGENNPADGLSFNWGGIPLDSTLSANPGGAERGWTASINHLAFQVDTWENGGGDNGLRIAGYPGGAEVVHAQTAGNILGDGTTVTGHVVVSWNPVDGASMTTTGFVTNVSFSGLNIPGLTASDANVFAFAGRTGGAHNAVYIDNFTLSTAPGVGVSTPNLAISEMVVDNTKYEDEHCQTPGWIELYNGTAAAISLNGWSLTDDSAIPNKWVFPNGLTVPSFGYTAVYFGTPPPVPPSTRLHTNFIPAKAGGYIGLYQSGVLVDSYNPYPAQFEDISYGRLGAAWTLGFLQTPSPGSKNNGVQNAEGPISEEVEWPRAGGLFSTNFTVALPPPVTPSAVIRYTTDNSKPTVSSPAYSNPISVTGNMNIRAAVFVPNRLPGPVTSRTFVKLDATLTNYRGTGQPFQSNLPVIMLDSFGQNIDGLRAFTYTYGVVLAPDPLNGNMTRLMETAPVDFTGRGGTHLRGESSAGMPQKQYAWETWDNENDDKATSILGMPAESDWILYAPATDKTMMRNWIVYNSMRELNGQGSAMRTRLVEVFFKQHNGATLTWTDYRGVYVLIEKIKRDKDRVDIEELKPCDTTPGLITGGYLFKKDKASVDPDFSTTNGQILQLIEPEVPINSPHYTWLRDHMNAFESTLYSNGFTDPVTGWRAYLDERSWQDNEWWVEIYKQIDGYRLSTYFHKDRGQKIKAAPLWDYNLSGGNGDYLAGWNYRGWYRDAGISQGQSGNTDFQYYWRLRQDPRYIRNLWDRYWSIRKGVMTTASLMNRIDQAAVSLTANNPNSDITNGTGTWPSSTPSNESPAARHHARWQQLGRYDWPNAPGFGGRTKWSSTTDPADYASLTNAPYNVTTPPAMSEKVHLKSFMTNRLNWIDNANISSNTILRPPVLSQEGGNVAPGYNLVISPFTATAPAAGDYGLSGTLTYATGPIFYTTNGSDPIGITTPGVSRSFITDSNACNACVPSSAAADTDSFNKNWKDWDFTVTAYNNPANLNGWLTGTNGVGYDDTRTSGVNFVPHINILFDSASNPVAGAPRMRNVNQTCYVRLPFTLTAGDIADITILRLHAMSDDGFIAYLNGVKIGERNPPTTAPTWNSGTVNAFDDAAASSFVEITAQNTAAAIAALRTGTNVLAVHCFNTGLNSADLLQKFRLSAETAPTVTGPTLYTGPVAINAPITIRARQFNSANSAWTPVATGTFVVDTVPASATNLAVSEIMYRAAEPTPAEVTAGYNNPNMFEYLEVMNISNSNVDLTGITFSGAFSYVWPGDNPSTQSLTPGERAVIVGDLAAFNYRYAPGPGVKTAGVFDGNLSNGGERIILTAAGPGGAFIKDFSYDDDAPWPSEADGMAYSLVLNHPLSNPNHNLPINWRASLFGDGTPGAAPGPSGPTGSAAAALADSDSDGISDLMEYATGTIGNNGGSQHPPVTGRITAVVPPALEAEEFLTYAYTRSRGADGFSFEPEVSTLLTGWQPLSALFTFIGQTNNGDGTATMTWRSTAPVSTLPGRIFLQVRAGISP